MTLTLSSQGKRRVAVLAPVLSCGTAVVPYTLQVAELVADRRETLVCF